jgi:hypothetical protein
VDSLVRSNRMANSGRRVPRWLPILLGGVLLLGPGAAPTFGQDETTARVAISASDDQQRFNPDLTQEVAGTEPEESPSDDPISDKDVQKTTGEQISNETMQQPGWGSAADQTQEAKRAEAEADCSADAQPPISKMLGLPSAVGASEGGALGWLILAIAAGALVVAGIAYAVRRGRGATAPRGSLESVATVVGILGGIAGLAVQFVPGVGVDEPPAPLAAMAVRDINTRITHLEYAKKTNSELPRAEDKEEVGNVIWLEVHMEGYRDKKPALQYALYDPDSRYALLPGTAKKVPIPLNDTDTETQFVPIWVGYPLSKHFQARFRLLDGSRVQAVAATDRMRASKYRYSCRT